MFPYKRLLATLSFLSALALPALAQERSATPRSDGEDAPANFGSRRPRSYLDEPAPESRFAPSRDEHPSRQGGPSEPAPLPSSGLVEPVWHQQNVQESEGSGAAGDDAEGAADGAPAVDSVKRGVPVTRRSEVKAEEDMKGGNDQKASALGVGLGSWKTMAGALAVVLGLFFLFAMFAKKAQPRTAARLPTDVLESLGQVALPSKQQLQLVRLGDKLILLSMTPSGASSVAEITDPEEVERLTGLCRQNQPGSFTNTFRRALAQFGDEPAPSGFLGDEVPTGRASAGRAPAGRPTASARSRR